MHRNPDPSASPRRSGGHALPIAVRRGRLWRRWGWPRRCVRRGEWFCGVDVGVASEAWVARAYALPPRPSGSPHAAAGRAWLARVERLKAWAVQERLAIRPPWLP